MLICGVASHSLNHGMEDANHMSIPVGMCIFGILVLICKDHYIGMGTNIDSVLVSVAIVHGKVDSQSLVTEDLIVVDQKLSAVTISELIPQSFS